MPQINKQYIRYQWSDGGPVITCAVIALCLVVWAIEVISYFAAPAFYSDLVNTLAFVPANAVVHPWTWLTSMFLHAPTIFHVLFNMMTLWFVGPMLERMLGHWHFLVLYLISGLGGAAGMMVWDRLTGNWLNSAYGASGALFGLFAAILIAYRRIGSETRSMLIWMVINFAMPLVIPNIAWQEHVGGFIIGGLLSWLLIVGLPNLRRRSLTARMAIYGGLIVCVAVAVMVLCAPYGFMAVA